MTVTDHRPTLPQRFRRRAARHGRGFADGAPPPFDIPCDGGSTIGARWAGGTLITIIGVTPRSPAVTILTPETSTVDDPDGQFVPLDMLADCLTTSDVRLAAIDVVGHGFRTRGPDTIARTYHRVLGPLAATAQRTALVILRLDPQTCAEAVTRRGGGAVGVLRSASIATRRVAARLGTAGLNVSILTATELTAVTGQLTENVSFTELTCDRGAILHGPFRFRTGSVAPARLERVLATIWANPAVATTAIIRLRRDTDTGLAVAALIRFTEYPRLGREVDLWPAGVRPLAEHPFAALAAGLPVASPGLPDRRLPVCRGHGAEELVRSLRFPAGGCGQLIGADRTGAAVAVPLFGPGVRDVMIAAHFAVVSQLVLRAVATGAAVAVHTVRPTCWRPLVSAVGDPSLLALSTDMQPPCSAYPIVLCDGTTGPPATTGATHVRIVGADAADGFDRPAYDSVLLRQHRHAPETLSVQTGTRRTVVTLVATPEEQSLSR